jgi:hypothetical protein
MLLKTIHLLHFWAIFREIFSYNVFKEFFYIFYLQVLALLLELPGMSLTLALHSWSLALNIRLQRNMRVWEWFTQHSTPGPPAAHIHFSSNLRNQFG